VGLECLAKGLPVIVNARGGVLDYALPGRTGWVNRSCTGEELAAIMSAVIDDPGQVVELNRSIRAARDELVKPLARHVAELDELYAEVSAASSSAGS
jgi:glycosyltransferase involved in cell wall biosynthesis